MGVGTSPLRRYGYSKIGTPAIIKKKLLKYNLTCTATISINGVEMIQFFDKSQTKTKTFPKIKLYFWEN